MSKLVLYLPVQGNRAQRYITHSGQWAQDSGHEITQISPSTAEIRRMIERGEVDAALVIVSHHRQRLKGLPVVEIPRQRPNEAWVGAGLLGLAVWLADRVRDHQLAATAATATATGAAGLALVGPAAMEPEAEPPGGGQSPATAAPLAPTPRQDARDWRPAPAPPWRSLNRDQPIGAGGGVSPTRLTPVETRQPSPNPVTPVTPSPVGSPSPPGTDSEPEDPLPSDGQNCLVDVGLLGIDLEVACA